ncbi:DUF6283 family protein (plasmid) [Streptomyces microflavus]|uniref:DUF6283 family protein n=1 Tax=Streptomyces microflavus TaxID=1919 RepID=UPI002E126AE3|nr:DUF6283 family protein [Streptomyces microflavus]WSR96556.1 DUF6283 family protein [Streptomyces microflavus]
MTNQPPAPRPCRTCPYRTDVPSGIWSQEEYDKLPPYDGPTWLQPLSLFLCHQHDADTEGARVCGGWAGCHDGDHLMALRVATATGAITPETAEATRRYTSPVPLFASGTEAAAHGTRDLHAPTPEALHAMAKIKRTRTHLS